MRRTAIALAMLVLAACGGGGGGDEAATPSGDRPQLEEAVRAYSDAYLGGQGDVAHQLLSARCRERLPVATLTFAATEAKRSFAGARMTTLDVETLEGSLARVTYRYDNPAIDQRSEPWVKEDGRWRQDDC